MLHLRILLHTSHTPSCTDIAAHDYKLLFRDGDWRTENPTDLDVVVDFELNESWLKDVGRLLGEGRTRRLPSTQVQRIWLLHLTLIHTPINLDFFLSDLLDNGRADGHSLTAPSSRPTSSLSASSGYSALSSFASSLPSAPLVISQGDSGKRRTHFDSARLLRSSV